MSLRIQLIVIFSSFALLGCGTGFSTKSSLLSLASDDYTGGSGKVTLSWAANREKAVNSAGGGYRIYYAQYSSVTESSPSVDVPFVSGSQAPTSAQLTGLISGTYYVRVKAYSTLNPSGSALSTTTQFTLQ